MAFSSLQSGGNGGAMVTVQDVARAAGVSRATASFVLRGRAVPRVSVSAGTRQRVLDAAAALGYRPNEIARAMVTGRNPVIGFVSYAPEVEAIARMLIGAIDAAEERDYSVRVFHVQGQEAAAHLARRCVEQRLAGLILARLDAGLMGSLQRETERYPMPVVTLATPWPELGGMHVAPDFEQAHLLAIDHLRELGHERIAMLSGEPAEIGVVLREQGFLAALRARGHALPKGYLRRCRWETAAVQQLVAEWRRLGTNQPTAVLCVTDKMAMTLLRACRRLAVPVPERLSVIGFGGLEMAEWSDPTLTTVVHPFDQMGRLAVVNLLERTSECPARDDAREALLPNRLVIRESTAAPSIP